MDVVFQPARDTDADVLLSMARAFHIEDGHPLDSDAEAAVVQIARGEPLARAWIVWQGAAAVGYVVITLGYGIEYGGRDGFIDDLYPVLEARGRGLGRRVLAFALAEAARLGIRMLHLD
jgi:GNAT superfamily N-acetyltransferase